MKTAANVRRASYQRHQRGVATLFTTVVILFVMSVMAIYATRGSVLENTLMNNAFRAKQAAEVADAALDFGLAAYLQGGVDANGDGAVDVLDPSAMLNGRRGTVQFCTDVSTVDACTPLATVSAGRAVIVAEGWSDDQTAVHRTSVLVTANPVIGGSLKSPLILKGASNLLSGSFQLTNNTDTGINIWTGADISTANGNFTTYGKVDGVEDQLISEKVPPRFFLGPDIVYNDQVLKNADTDGFYEEVLGQTKTDLAAGAGVRASAANPLEAGNLYEGEIIFFDGDLSLGQSLGSATRPVILVVNGQFSFTGNRTLYGAVVATSLGNIAGTTRVVGSLVAENANNLVGTANIEMNDQVVQGLQAITRQSIIGNSWRDW